jgi:hypothetical protein
MFLDLTFCKELLPELRAAVMCSEIFLNYALQPFNIQVGNLKRSVFRLGKIFC